MRPQAALTDDRAKERAGAEAGSPPVATNTDRWRTCLRNAIGKPNRCVHGETQPTSLFRKSHQKDPVGPSINIQNVQFSPDLRRGGNGAESRNERRDDRFERRGNRAYYNGHRGCDQPRRSYRQHNGVWFPAVAFIADAIVGGAIDNQAPCDRQRPCPVLLRPASVVSGFGQNVPAL